MKYKCPECGWIGTEDEMECDYIPGPPGEEYSEEVWSNWICPKCHMWWQLEDYIEVK